MIAASIEYCNWTRRARYGNAPPMVSLFPPSMAPGRFWLPATLTYHSLRIVLSLLFFYAGWNKLNDIRSFEAILDAFGLLPESWLRPVAIALPLLELGAALGLLLEMRGSLTTIAALLALFSAILGYGIHMGLDIDCGCFGPEDPQSRAYAGLRSALLRDLAMLAATAWLFGYRLWRRRVHQKPACSLPPNPTLMEDASP